MAWRAAVLISFGLAAISYYMSTSLHYGELDNCRQSFGFLDTIYLVANERFFMGMQDSCF